MGDFIKYILEDIANTASSGNIAGIGLNQDDLAIPAKNIYNKKVKSVASIIRRRKGEVPDDTNI